MFLVGFGTWMASKEIYVFEHEFYCGLALFWTCKSLEDHYLRSVYPVNPYWDRRHLGNFFDVGQNL